jgi:hypothetical protein
MDNDVALSFLRNHQPMPDDETLDETLAREYEAVRKHFETVNDRRSVPLLLNSFGRGTGFGVYQLVEDALGYQDADAVRTALPSAIRSRNGGVRVWSIEIAVRYASRNVLDAIKEVWSELDADRRFWAAKILRIAFSPSEDRDFLASILTNENDPEVRSELSQITNDS